MMAERLRHHGPLVLITILFILLGITYSLVTPIFEASDEISHYPVVQHIASTGRLPVQRPGVETLWEQEGSQPPLYYLIAAGLTFWIDTSDLESVRWRNPHAKLGIPLDPDNRNMVIHTAGERFPWHGTVLAIHLIRIFGVGLGAGTVVLTYLIAREVQPAGRWLAPLAAAFTAFNPMFLFITGSVNNDNLTVLLSSWSILLCLRVASQGITDRRALALAVVTAAATLTKISGLTLLPLVGITLLIAAARRGHWRKTFYAGGALILCWLAVAGWWYARNLILYGELLGLQTHVAIAGGREIDLLTLLRHEWYGFWVSYWALFGAVNILADQAVYTFYALLGAAALIGLVLWGMRRLREQARASLLMPGLLAFQILMVLAGVIRWTMTTYASQGRLMFPVIGGLSTLTALGLLHLLPTRWHTGAAAILAGLLALVAAAAPFRYIAPAYARPPEIATTPDDATPVEADFQGLNLVAARVESVVTGPGGRIPVTLYWRVDERLAQNYSIYLHALGREAQEIGKIDTYPGGGSLPTSQMEPGTIIEDRYSLELDPTFEAPTRLRVQVGIALHNGDGVYQIIEPLSASGETAGSVLLEAGVAYPEEAAACLHPLQSSAPLASLGGFAALWAEPQARRYRPNDVIPIDLIWDRTAETTVDWTVFLHLVDPSGTVVAQADGPPLGGDYPTSLWKHPCAVQDTHLLALPPALPAGRYRLLVGLYDPADPAYGRAPALKPDGSPYPNAAVPLGYIEVIP